MKKLFLVLSVLFTLLTLAGAGFVLSSGGALSPGYAVVPMVFALVFLTLYRRAR